MIEVIRYCVSDCYDSDDIDLRAYYCPRCGKLLKVCDGQMIWYDWENMDDTDDWEDLDEV